MKCVLLRHFHSEGDELSEHGFAQAESLASILNDKEYSVVFTGHERCLNSYKALISYGVKFSISEQVDTLQPAHLNSDIIISQQPLLLDFYFKLFGESLSPSKFIQGRPFMCEY